MARLRPEQTYPSDLTDDEWAIVAPLIPQPTGKGRGRGRPRTVNIRQILNALFYIERTGCQWDYLPRDFPKRDTVRYYYDAWRRDGTWVAINTALREQVRRKAGRDPEPSAAIVDSQSCKTTEAGGPRGYDAGKKVAGRKRHIAVDTLGLLLVVFVHPASWQDRDGACDLFQRLSELLTRLRLIWVDGGYAGQLVTLAWNLWRYTLHVVKRPETAAGFVVLARRWVVERTLAWFGRNRRLSKDYEKLPSSSETVVYLASIRLMLRRLAS